MQVELNGKVVDVGVLQHEAPVIGDRPLPLWLADPDLPYLGEHHVWFETTAIGDKMRRYVSIPG